MTDSRIRKFRVEAYIIIMIIMMIIIITIIFHVGFGNFTFIGMAIKSIVISFNETVPYKIDSVSL